MWLCGPQGQLGERSEGVVRVARGTNGSLGPHMKFRRFRGSRKSCKRDQWIIGTAYEVQEIRQCYSVKTAFKFDVAIEVGKKKTLFTTRRAAQLVGQHARVVYRYKAGLPENLGSALPSFL